MKVWGLEFDQRNNSLISCSYDKTIKCWDLDSLNCLKTLKGHSKSVNAVKLVENDLLVSCSDDFTLKLWDLKEQRIIRTLEGLVFF